MISIKKLATVGAAAGLLAASALPVLADDELEVEQENKAYVRNDVDSEANTGKNDIGGGRFVLMSTGNATSYVDVSTTANKNVAIVEDCDCFDELEVEQENKAYVRNDVDSEANTGKNDIGGGRGVIMRTGDAFSCPTVTNVVNKNVAVVGD